MTIVALPTSRAWNQFFVYSLLCCSAFSIAGSDLSLLGLYLIFLLKAWRSRPAWSVQNPFMIAILGILISNIVSGLMTPYESGSLKALHNNWRLFLPFALYAGISEVDQKKLLHGVLVCLVIVSCYGILQFFTGAEWLQLPGHQHPKPYKHPDFGLRGYTSFFHTKGLFSNHLTFGGVWLIYFPLFLSLCFCNEFPFKQRVFYTLGVLCMLLSILTSLARSVWIGSATAILILSFRLPKKIWKLFVSVMAGTLFLFFVIYSMQSSELQSADSAGTLIWQRLVSGLSPKYNQDRLLMWESGWNAIQDHFWVGIGLENDGEVMPLYRDSISERTGHRFFNKPSAGVHNLYLQTWINFGLVGLLSYLGFLITFLFLNFSGIAGKGDSHDFHKSILWGAIASTIGYASAGIFENNFYDSEVQIALLILMGISLWSQRELAKKNSS